MSYPASWSKRESYLPHPEHRFQGRIHVLAPCPGPSREATSGEMEPPVGRYITKQRLVPLVMKLILVKMMMLLMITVLTTAAAATVISHFIASLLTARCVVILWISVILLSH